MSTLALEGLSLRMLSILPLEAPFDCHKPTKHTAIIVINIFGGLNILIYTSTCVTTPNFKRPAVLSIALTPKVDNYSLITYINLGAGWTPLPIISHLSIGGIFGFPRVGAAQYRWSIQSA